jgi:hypothetical protein
MNDTTRTDIFLGGSCDPTTWRTDVAIPVLEQAGVSYYNPQVDDWSPELVALEAQAKDSASTCLFVIDSQTRAMASAVEAAELISAGRNVALVVLDIEDGLVIGGETVTGRQLKDLNRMRAYLRDVAQRHDVPAYDSVEAAVEALAARYGR